VPVMPPEEQIVRHIHENKDSRPDSIEIGSPSKGGTIKVYFNADNPDRACELIDHAIVVRVYAQNAYQASVAKQQGV
jgi:hypothetical protein